MLTTSDETQANIAVDRLMSDILAGVLVPGGKLRVAELKATYGFGASPLREALSRVTSLGYVTNESRRGYRVAAVSRADLADITQARQVVEAGMLRESMATRLDEWELGIVGALETLRWAVRKNDREGSAGGQRIGRAHKHLHVALVAGCTSPRLVAMQNLLFDQAYRYREMMISDVVSGEAFIGKHERLVEAVIGNDVETAVAALSDHLGLTLRDVYGSQEPTTSG